LSHQSLTGSRSVPTQNDILVPETLLKKRKSQEKAREERALATKEKRGTFATTCYWGLETAIVMIITTTLSARLRSMLSNC
jgi:hypothetical protein